MKRSKIATLTKASKTAVVYYDNYGEDYCAGKRGKSGVPEEQPIATLEGDDGIKEEFDLYSIDAKELLRPWRLGTPAFIIADGGETRQLAIMFAEKYGYEIQLEK